MQQAATELGEDLATDIVLALEELDGTALTHLGHVLRLTTSSFNALVTEESKRIVSKSWENKSELMSMLNREYASYLGSLFKEDVETTFSNLFD